MYLQFSFLPLLVHGLIGNAMELSFSGMLLTSVKYICLLVTRKRKIAFGLVRDRDIKYI